MDFKEIIKNNGAHVRSIIRRITNETNEGSAEDLEQEVYLRIWKNADKYEEQGNFKAWVKTVTANISKDYLKSSQKKISEMTTYDEDALVAVSDKKTTPELKLVQNERQQTIAKAINELKPKFKEVIILCEIENKSYEEIAEKLKCPIGTVKSRIYNAKKELAEKLQDLI